MAPLEILVVEDHAVVQGPLCRYLRHRGHSVVLATDLLDARRALSSGKFQLVFAEIHLPDGDGTELLEALPEDCSMVTVSGFDFALPLIRRETWLGHLTKPYMTEDLLLYLAQAATAFAPGRLVEV
jgi:CheY-like chemotaxis protein